MLFKIGVDGTHFETGMKRVQSTGTAFAKDFKKEVGSTLAAAFSVGAVAAFGKQVVDVADNIGDLAEQLGITTDQVQILQALAGQTGVKFETMSKALDVVNGKRLDAIETDGQARKSFTSLGISVEELNRGSLDNVTLLERMGASHLKSGRNAETQAALVDLLGMKAFRAADAIAKINELGPIKLISPQDIKDIGQLADTIDQIKRDVIVSVAPEVSFWGRAAKRAAADDATRKDGFLGFLQQLTGKGSILKAGVNELFADQSQLNETFPAEPLAPKQIGKLNAKDIDKAKEVAAKQREAAAMSFNLGQAADPMARIGGFTAFGASQDRVIQNLQEQVRQLAHISRNTEETSRVLKS